ncbi:MAG TPA: SprT family zinc-dependent metalloprotease [Steroidobacteraceae bacterium]
MLYPQRMSAQLQLFESKEATPHWTVRVSRRARRLSVRVYPGGRVEIVVPPGASAGTVQRFVGAHREWIAARIADLSAMPGATTELRPSRIELPAVHRSYAVEYRPSPSRTTHAMVVDGSVLAVVGNTSDTRLVGQALRNWLFDLAEFELGRELASVAARGGFEYKRLQVRLQRTRWGSCSATGTISLNVCVLFQSPEVLRYLLVHELSHTRHMNHSRKFWTLVRSLEPDYERLDRELLRGWQHVPGWVFN